MIVVLMSSISWYNLSITVIKFLEHLLKYRFILVGPQNTLALKPLLQQDRWNDKWLLPCFHFCLCLSSTKSLCTRKCTMQIHTWINWQEYLQALPLIAATEFFSHSCPWTVHLYQQFTDGKARHDKVKQNDLPKVKQEMCDKVRNWFADSQVPS